MCSVSEQFFKYAHDEVFRAAIFHGPSNSMHESYAVLLEELDEFWDEVKKKEPNLDNACVELVQIAAMACKAYEQIQLKMKKEGWNDEYD